MSQNRSLFARIMGRWRNWTFRPAVIDRKVVGEEIRFYIGDLFGKGWYGPQHEPWPELEWIKRSGIRAGDVVLDCGANHGFTTVLFARWTGPAGHVYAFEPSAHNVAILERNLQLNRITNATVRPVAVGAENGSALITNISNAAVVQGSGAQRDVCEVPLRRLDDEVPEGPVNFLKIDVEGLELQVLRGASRILSQRPRIALELHVFAYEDKVRELSEIFALLPLAAMHSEIQLSADGPIIKMNAEEHSPEKLQGLKLVHLFLG